MLHKDFYTITSESKKHIAIFCSKTIMKKIVHRCLTTREKNAQSCQEVECNKSRMIELFLVQKIIKLT